MSLLNKKKKALEQSLTLTWIKQHLAGFEKRNCIVKRLIENPF